MKQLPSETLRLFPSYSADALARDTHRRFVIERLLEEGDRNDLGWLSSAIEEDELARWVEERGARQLSRRSLAFWSRLLGTPSDGARNEALWPL